jgi:hypothetical protein
VSTQRNPTTVFLVLGGVGCAVLLAAIFWPSASPEPANTPPLSRPALLREQAGTRAPRRLQPPGNTTAQPPPSDDTVPSEAVPRRVDPRLGKQLMLRQGPAQRLMAAAPPSQAPASPGHSPSENNGDAPRGSIPREQIKAAIQDVIPSVRHCYESGLKLRDGSRGRVTASFTLVVADGGGFMRDAEIVDSALNNPLTDSCVLEALSNAHFPMPEGGGEVRVTYPFNFESSDPDAGVTR